MTKTRSVSLKDLEALASARRNDRRYPVCRVYQPSPGPMWHGVVRHPQMGMVRIPQSEQLVAGSVEVVGTVGRAEAAELLVASMWGDEAKKAGIMPYSAALRTLDWLQP